jgi:hypothetical protein
VVRGAVPRGARAGLRDQEIPSKTPSQIWNRHATWAAERSWKGGKELTEMAEAAGLGPAAGSRWPSRILCLSIAFSIAPPNVSRRVGVVGLTVGSWLGDDGRGVFCREGGREGEEEVWELRRKLDRGRRRPEVRWS